MKEDKSSLDIIEEVILESIEDYCNVIFDRNDLPGGVILAIHRKMKQEGDNYGVTSEKLSDLSKTYASPEVLNKDWRNSLEPYCRPHLVSSKRKRYYKDGR